MAVDVIKQLNYEFDFDKVRNDVMVILEEHNFIPQIGLTHSIKAKTFEEKILESTGSIFDFDSKEYKFKETDFTIFNEAYKGTYLYEMYRAVPNIGRFRIMTMTGPMCYTSHRDLSKRYHFVIETNPECLFLFPGIKQMHHIPMDGSLYLVDTRYKHTFVNGSRQRRIHLVMDDLGSLLNSRK